MICLYRERDSLGLEDGGGAAQLLPKTGPRRRRGRHVRLSSRWSKVQIFEGDRLPPKGLEVAMVLWEELVLRAGRGVLFN